MRDWVNDKLNRMIFETEDPPVEGIYSYEIEQAEQGDIEPLRLRYPHLARFLHLPKLGRGKHRLRRDSHAMHPVDAAADDVERILKLWKQHYDKRNRKTDPTAAQIAAARHKVDVRSVASKWRKRPSR